MKLQDFFSTHPVFTHEELVEFLAAQGSRNVKTRESILNHYIKTGRLLRPRRGLYLTVLRGHAPEKSPVDSYLLASKLAPDAVRNTNLQIAHQLRHRSDREAIAAAMIMDEAQREYLGKLRVGEAAVFLTGYDRATFMRVPNYKDEAGFDEPPDERVESHMSGFRAEHVSAYLPFDGCRFCAQHATTARRSSRTRWTGN